MENKPAQNIQDSFLNTARKDKTQVTIYLLSGVKLTGRIRSFDKYSVVLETNNQEQLIFKHAISTVVMSKGSTHHLKVVAGTMWDLRSKALRPKWRASPFPVNVRAVHANRLRSSPVVTDLSGRFS